MDSTLWRDPYTAAKNLAPVFKAMKWTWGKEEPPTEDEITARFEEMQEGRWEDKEVVYSATGGLAVLHIPKFKIMLYGLEMALKSYATED